MSNYLIHHGIKGQKWGIRRFQNEDGSLTEAGLKRAGKYHAKFYRKYEHDPLLAMRDGVNLKEWKDVIDQNRQASSIYDKAYKRQQRFDNAKSALAIGGQLAIGLYIANEMRKRSNKMYTAYYKNKGETIYTEFSDWGIVPSARKNQRFDLIRR